MAFAININGSERAIDVDGDTPVLWANRNAGITWNKAQFLDYIKDPRAKIPGTKMAFAGVKSESEANDLWAYISQFGADGKKKWRG